MDKCLNCDKELVHTIGRRKKLYCDNNGKCKQEFWIKTHKESEPKYVQFKTFKELSDKFHAVTKNKYAVPATEKTDVDTAPETDLSEIQKQIAAIQSEKIPKERDTSLGRKYWKADQQKRISELQKQII